MNIKIISNNRHIKCYKNFIKMEKKKNLNLLKLSSKSMKEVTGGINDGADVHSAWPEYKGCKLFTNSYGFNQNQKLSETGAIKK